MIAKNIIITFLIPCSWQHTLQIGNEDKSMTAAIGHMSEFQPQRENVILIIWGTFPYISK